MRRPALLLPLLAALACRPTAGHSAGETLAPLAAADSAQDPVVSCVDAVLTASPQIERITFANRADPRKRFLVLRNPPSPRATGVGFIIEPSRGAPRQFVVQFSWPGPWHGTGGMQPPTDRKLTDMEGEMLTDISTGLLRDVRAQCAPNAPGETACSRVSQGQGERCVLGV